MKAQPVKVGGRWVYKSWHTGPNGGDCWAITEDFDEIVDTKNGASIAVSPKQARALIDYAKDL